jgi:deazaflavin-dependent oxidoreductase (nitroreductase family)
MAQRTRLQFLRPFTTKVFNRFSRLFAGWLPGFGLLIYRGRKTGKEYRTPMNVFRRGDHYVFALTYGPDVQWVRNILASGECGLRTMGRDLRLVEPELYSDPALRDMPLLIRPFLRLMRVTALLRMRIDGATPA